MSNDENKWITTCTFVNGCLFSKLSSVFLLLLYFIFFESLEFVFSQLFVDLKLTNVFTVNIAYAFLCSLRQSSSVFDCVGCLKFVFIWQTAAKLDICPINLKWQNDTDIKG